MSQGKVEGARSHLALEMRTQSLYKDVEIINVVV